VRQSQATKFLPEAAGSIEGQRSFGCGQLAIVNATDTWKEPLEDAMFAIRPNRMAELIWLWKRLDSPNQKVAGCASLKTI